MDHQIRLELEIEALCRRLDIELNEELLLQIIVIVKEKKEKKDKKDK